MSHFLDRLTFFKRIEGDFADGHGITTNEDRALGGRLPQALAARQDRALHARGQLHRLVLVEDLRQGRHRHLGDAADRLSAHAARPAQPRAARLLARRELQLVPLLRQPREVSAGALAAAEAVARGARDMTPGGGLGVDRRGPGEARGVHAGSAASAASCARPGTRSTRSSPPPTPTRPRPTARTACSASRRSRRCRWCPTPRARAICRCSAASACRSTTGTATCRRPRPQTWGEQTDVPEIGRLVQLRLPHPVGLERAADAHAGRALLHRGPLQGRQERRRSARTIRRPRSSPTCGCSVKQGTDAALAMAMGHVILREFHVDRQARVLRRLRPRSTRTCRCWCAW